MTATGALGRYHRRRDFSGEKEAWLLVKHADERTAAAGTPDPRRARSARTGHTLKQVAAAARGGTR